MSQIVLIVKFSVSWLNISGLMYGEKLDKYFRWSFKMIGNVTERNFFFLVLWRII